MKSLSRIICVVLLLAVAPPLRAQTEADTFYLQRLEGGKAAWQAGRYFDAVAELRIASFGLLDDLELLSESLARLAVAQHAAGMQEETTDTLRRFVEVETAAGSYGSYRLEEDVRRSLESLLQSAIPNDRLSGIETLSHLHTSAVDRMMSLSGRERTRALTDAREKSPDEVRWYVLLTRDALERRSTRDARRWAEAGLEVDPRETELLEVVVELDIREGNCEAAWRMVKGIKPFPDDTAERVFLCLSDQSRDELALEVLGELERRKVSLSVGATRAASALRSKPEETRSAPPVQRGAPEIIDQTGRPPEEPGRPEIADETTDETTAVGEPPRDADPPPGNDPPGVMARAEMLVSTGRPAEAKVLLLSLPKDAASRGLDLALLEAAVLTSDWTLARRKLASLTPLRRSEPASIFYAAVTLFESGRYEEAKRLFQVARPLIATSPFVERYERLILTGKP